jgi:23S rRNA (pseudouridine1915-N3)-methyltransferase
MGRRRLSRLPEEAPAVLPLEVVEVREEDLNRRTPEEVLAAEAERLLRRIPAGAYVIALDREKGEPLSSPMLERRINSLGLSGRSHVAFVLGGPLGLSERCWRGRTPSSPLAPSPCHTPWRGWFSWSNSTG